MIMIKLFWLTFSLFKVWLSTFIIVFLTLIICKTLVVAQSPPGGLGREAVCQIVHSNNNNPFDTEPQSPPTTFVKKDLVWFNQNLGHSRRCARVSLTAPFAHMILVIRKKKRKSPTRLNSQTKELLDLSWWKTLLLFPLTLNLSLIYLN